MNPHPTAAAALDTTELGGLIADLEGFEWLPGIHHLRAFLTEAAIASLTGQLDDEATQTLAAVIAGSNGADGLTGLGQLVALITNPDTNPALQSLQTLDPDRAKEARLHGEHLVHHLADDDKLHQHAADAAYTITNH